MDEKIRRLREQNIYFGTSSWKYPGWRNLVYRRKYPSEKNFNDNCLEEYASAYPAVGVDHTFYNWPSEKGFDKYAAQTPEYFRFGLKTTERITIFDYPKIKRYGKEAGTTNADFLNADLFRDKFLAPLESNKSRIGPVMLEFSQFYPGTIASGGEFVERLDRFFTAVGHNTGFQFALEIRNRNWLQKPYFDLLLKHNVGHVYNSWTRMPTIGEQLTLSANYKLPFLVSRLLLQPGTKYADAVEAFSPYDQLKEESPTLRKETADLIRRAIASGTPAYVFVNNRCEGSAPKTIEAILANLD